MKREQSSGTFLSAVFVDYDNIYMSLKRKNDEAAKRFAKDAHLWIKAIETGSLITPTNGPGSEGFRRIVMNRCYGNPVPRRNQGDNSTDMSSFPFVRHHFLRSGFEIVDCPPLTAQLKNSSDIRMVMDVRDYLTHPTYFDEFVILSGDADFTPVLHRLRAHARRTVIFANDNTAAPYTAICDGEIRESDLIALLLEGRLGAETPVAELVKPEAHNLETIRREIIADVIAAVRSAQAPVPLEVLADRAVRQIGHERTIGTSWAGSGGFRELLAKELPDGLRLSGEPPYVVIDTSRHVASQPATLQPVAAPVQPAQIREAAPQPMQASQQIAAQLPSAQQLPAASQTAPVQPGQQPAERRDFFGQRQTGGASQVGAQMRGTSIAQQPTPQPMQSLQSQPVAAIAVSGQASPATYAPQHPVAPQYNAQPVQPAPTLRARSQDLHVPQQAHTPQQQAPQQQGARAGEQPSGIQHSISRIHDACQAPPLAPPEYRLLFESIAHEINENGLIGAQTIHNIAQRVQDRGIEMRRDDVRFVLEVVSEADPWFEQGASANLFAGRFRNFVVARCRSQGLNLSADELDLIEAWFAGSTPQPQVQAQIPTQAPVQSAPQAPAHQQLVQQPMQRSAPNYAEPAAGQMPVSVPAPVQRQQHMANDPRNSNWSLEEGRQYVAETRQPVRAPQQPMAEAIAEDFPRIVRTRLRG